MCRSLDIVAVLSSKDTNGWENIPELFLLGFGPSCHIYYYQGYGLAMISTGEPGDVYMFFSYRINRANALKFDVSLFCFLTFCSLQD